MAHITITLYSGGRPQFGPKLEWQSLENDRIKARVLMLFLLLSLYNRDIIPTSALRSQPGQGLYKRDIIPNALTRMHAKDKLAEEVVRGDTHKSFRISDASSTMSSLTSYFVKMMARSAAWSGDRPYFSGWNPFCSAFCRVRNTCRFFRVSAGPAPALPLLCTSVRGFQGAASVILVCIHQQDPPTCQDRTTPFRSQTQLFVTWQNKPPCFR